MSEVYFVIPVINCLDMTKDAIASIKCSKSYSIILIDQDSNDGTEEWGRSMDTFNGSKENQPENMKDFIYIKNSPKIALAAAWNQGVKRAFEDPECKYVALPNNDVIFHPKTWDHLIAFMDKTGYLMVTGDNIKDRMSNEIMQQMELPHPFTDYDCQEITDWRAEGPDFSCFLINRETIRVIGWFDENFQGAYCEDQDYHARFNRALRHAKIHNDQGLDPNRIHAKRLSTAPYFHYASQTMVRNIPLRHDITTMHGKNQNYYLTKWGGEHPAVMDGQGNIQPFGDATKNWRDW